MALLGVFATQGSGSCLGFAFGARSITAEETSRCVLFELRSKGWNPRHPSPYRKQKHLAKDIRAMMEKKRSVGTVLSGAYFL